MKKKLMTLSLSFLAVILFGVSASAQRTADLPSFPTLTNTATPPDAPVWTYPTDPKVMKVVRIFRCVDQSPISTLELGIDGVGIVLTPGRGEWARIYSSSNPKGSYSNTENVFIVPNKDGSHIFEYLLTSPDELCGLTTDEKIWFIVHVLPNAGIIPPQVIEACAGTTLAETVVEILYNGTSSPVYDEVKDVITIAWTPTELWTGGYEVKTGTDTTFTAVGVINYGGTGVNCGDTIKLNINVKELAQPTGPVKTVCIFDYANGDSIQNITGRPIGSIAGVTYSYALPILDKAALKNYPEGSLSDDVLYGVYTYTAAGTTTCSVIDTVLFTKDFTGMIDTLEICKANYGTEIGLDGLLSSELGYVFSSGTLTWKAYGQADLSTLPGTIPTINPSDALAFLASPARVPANELDARNFVYHYKSGTGASLCDVDGWLMLKRVQELSKLDGRIIVCESYNEFDLAKGLLTSVGSENFTWTYAGVPVVGGIVKKTDIDLGTSGQHVFTYSSPIVSGACGAASGKVVVEVISEIKGELLSKSALFCIEDLASKYNLSGLSGILSPGAWTLTSVTGGATTVADLVNNGALVNGVIETSQLFGAGLLDYDAIKAGGADVTLVFTYKSDNTPGPGLDPGCVVGSDEATFTMKLTDNILQ